MEPVVRELAAFVGSMVFGVGPVALLVGLLNRRDRRAAALIEVVSGVLPAVAVRSDVAIAVRCPLLAGRSTVTVDMLASSPEEVWGALRRLRRALPPRVELRVVSWIERGPVTQLTELAVVKVGRAA